MSASSIVANISKSPAIGYAILGVVAIAGFVVVKNALAQLANGLGDLGSKAANAAGAAGTAVLDTAGGIATGNNVTTHGTPYEGTGILGTLGGATDKLFGGGLSAIGGWIGSTVFDVTHPSDNASADGSGSTNLANYGWTGNPYAGGSNATYAGATDASPTPAAGGSNAITFGGAANPNAQAPLANDFGVADPSSGW